VDSLRAWPVPTHRATDCLNYVGGDMQQEQRNTIDPLPYNFYERLNPDQLLALWMLENYGWSMKFVRRSLNQNQQYAVLDEDGTLNIESGIKIRN